MGEYVQTNFNKFSVMIKEDIATFDYEVDKQYNFKNKYRKNIYTFKTENGFNYRLYINDVLRGEKYFGTNIVEFVFSAYKDVPDPRDTNKMLNNPKEIFKVMNTIFTCIKEFAQENMVKYIVYEPTKTEGYSESDEKRAKLYNHYFNKYFPNCKIEKIKKEYFVEI